MSQGRFSARRLYVRDDLAQGANLLCDRAQTNYVRNVLRLQRGDGILLFNGRDGEWRAELVEGAKSATQLQVREQVRAQQAGPDIDYLFAPLKRARLDYMVQKATEMGVARLRPVLTRRTTPERVNLARMRANAIEAAEQCGLLRLPQLQEPERLEHAIERWDGARSLIFCDTDGQAAAPLSALLGLAPGPLALLIGPEGGFDPSEHRLLLGKPFVVRISLGPRILRADTAAIAALALINALIGDWR